MSRVKGEKAVKGDLKMQISYSEIYVFITSEQKHGGNDDVLVGG